MCSLLYGCSTVSTYHKLSTDSSRLVVVYREFIILEECITEHYYAIHLQSKWISWRPFKVLANSCQLDDVQKCDNNSLEKNHCETKFKHVQNSCRNDEQYTWSTQCLHRKKNKYGHQTVILKILRKIDDIILQVVIE